MARVLQLRRGTTAENNLFTGAVAEATYDTDRKELRIHDGSTVGGKVVSAPTGAVMAFAGSSAPEGWLVCDGSAVSRTTYADLFAVIGTTYGSGDGSTTFNLPNRTPTRTLIEEKQPDSQDSFRWYRLYDDGWVEQGGIAFAPVNKLVPMLVEMADTYYDAVVTPSSNINVWPLAWADRSRSTTTSVYIDGYGDLHQTNRNIDVNWMVSGMSTRGATQQNIVCIKY